MPQDVAELYGSHMMALATQARGVIRDLNPKNELRFLRVRTRKQEIMVAYGIYIYIIMYSHMYDICLLKYFW